MPLCEFAGILTKNMASFAFQCPTCGFQSIDADAFICHRCESAGALTTINTVAYGSNFPTQHTEGTWSQASANNSSEESSCLERWDDKHVQLLISCYADHKHLLGKGKNTKRDIFSRIAFSFNKQSELMVTGDQCMRKLIKLEKKFKEIEDHNNQTGNNKKTMKHYNELSECIGSDPRVSPVMTLESDPGSAADMAEKEVHSDSDKSSGSLHVKGKRPPRKRKSYSSAAEMLTFMKEYSQKREKVEEEKVQLMREIKEDRKNFFTEFLDIMKNK